MKGVYTAKRAPGKHCLILNSSFTGQAAGIGGWSADRKRYNASDHDRSRFAADWVYVSVVVCLNSVFACASGYTVVFASPTFALIVALVIFREARSAHLIGRYGK